jgi:hypothetical protein
MMMTSRTIDPLASEDLYALPNSWKLPELPEDLDKPMFESPYNETLNSIKKRTMDHVRKDPDDIDAFVDSYVDNRLT